MSNTTSRLGLFITPENTDETFKEWRMKINGDTNSNMTIIDDKVGHLIDELENIPSSSSRSADIVIAAYDASNAWKECADYVCDGYADQVEINNAISQLKSNNKLHGKVLLSTGTFFLSGYINLVPYSSSTVPDISLVIEGTGDGTRVCTATQIYEPYSGFSAQAGIFYTYCTGADVKVSIKNMCICNNSSLCPGVIQFMTKRVELSNITLKSAYSVPSSLGYTARSFTYDDDPGVLWGVASNDVGSDLIQINNCRILSDYVQTIDIACGIIINRLYLHSNSTIKVGYNNIVDILSDTNTDEIKIIINGSNNRVVKNPYVTITNSGSNNTIA